jgi:FKBP-type peptidyl-prolyl cis-trans isomerase
MKMFAKLLMVVIACTSMSACAKKTNNEEAAVNLSPEEKLIAQKWPNAVKTSTGLMYVVIKEGTGSKPTRGTLVTAHYTGTLLDGKKFDSSVDRGQPFKFKVGTGQVIQGWDEAFLDMKKGEKRMLILPYNLAYGEAGHPPVIPPRATLIFDVEMIDF